MPHIDPEQLALLAMGEPVASDRDTDHLADCDVCAEELALLRHAAIVGRSAIDAGEIEAPPEAVWARIAEQLQLDGPEGGQQIADAALEPSATKPHPSVDVAPVPRRARLRRRVALAWTLAAAVVVVAGVAVGSWAVTQGTALTEVAAAPLEPFPGHPGAQGFAVVEEEPDGNMIVRVSVDAESAPDTYREVWLITGDASALISLGVLTGTEGTFPVPAGVDLRDYVLVDVSQELIDGDPGHSGDSIVRGELGFV